MRVRHALTAEQQAAAYAPAGSLLIVAGPGSGKTAVLAARIAYLIRVLGVGAPTILALAFAAKAARELRERLDLLLGGVGDAVDVATFHSFGLRVVRQWPTRLGYRPGPLHVYGPAEARAVLLQVATRIGLDIDGLPAQTLARAMERCRLGDGTNVPPLGNLAAAYEAELWRRNALDYAAMLVLPLRLLRADSTVARFYQTAYRAVLVDEAQDVSAAQYALVRLLSARHRCAALVGDPAQSLYGWRGADGRAIRDFPRHFPEAHLVLLRQNFRSTPQIVAAANAVGNGLPGRRDLWTANAPGAPLTLHAAADADVEAAFVATAIARLLQDGTVRHPGEAAILFRTNEQARPFLLELRKRGLPYQPRGDDLFARREVRDATAFMRLALDPEDEVGLARIARSFLRVGPLPDAVSSADLVALADRRGPPGRQAIRELLALVADLHRRAAGLAPVALLDLALERSGYRAWLARQPDGIERLGHLATLHRLAADAEGDLTTWLAGLAFGDTEESAQQRIRLLTIHEAKGGEWATVFLVGWEEGLLPHRWTLRSPSEVALLDERRVAYVGVTRPRHRLYITWCRTRGRGDERSARRPSRFLQEIAAARAVSAA